MKAKEYAENLRMRIINGWTVSDALQEVAMAFVREYNQMVSGKNGWGVRNAMKEQRQKWAAMARIYPSYGIKEDGFMAILEVAKPELVKAYREYDAIVANERNRK